MMISLASLSLYRASPDQVIESRRRTCVQWARGATVEEYLQLNQQIDEHQVSQNGNFITWVLTPRDHPTTLDFMSSCETFRRTGTVVRGTVAEDMTCYGIASVFTPSQNRGKGYARHMMQLLHWVLARQDFLPTFPEEWGAPPQRVENCGDALVSALWSDVGPKIYTMSGMSSAAKRDGWVVRAPFSTIWSVSDLPASNSVKGAWNWLSIDQFDELWLKESPRMVAKMKESGSQVSFTYLPHGGVDTLQRMRVLHQIRDIKPKIETWGVISAGEPVAYAGWTFDISPPNPPTLLVTRLEASPGQFEEMLGKMGEIAVRHGMEQIEVWNLPKDLGVLAAKFGGKELEREEHLPSFKWYGKESPEDVEWCFNERFCWC
ncbi:hypothetical protein C8J56DRAFT_933618 [Mycena floridula]|nr:hypothetical protein C8J56DRAFT_933618 [Mycena floridula]